MQGIRVLAVLVAAVIVCGTGIALGADGAPSHDAAPLQVSADQLSAPPPGRPGPEVTARRTATSETFRLPNGAFETQIHAIPIHYRDVDGDWKPIDESLREPVDQAGLVNGENSFDLKLPERMGEGAVRLAVDEHWVSYRLLRSETLPVQLKNEGIASYEDSEAGLTYELTSFASGLKEEIVLSGPAAPAQFSFELSASENLVPSLTEKGSIEFRDLDKRAVVILPPPVMTDSAPDQPNISDEVRYLLEPEGNQRWRLVVAAERKWLEQPDRVWPVKIDPTLTVSSPSLDCTYGGKKLVSGYNGWGLCGSGGQKELYARYQRVGSDDEWARSLLRFSLSGMYGKLGVEKPEIMSAVLSVHASAQAVNTSGLEARRVTKSWTNDVNWRRYNFLQSWGTEGGDYAADGDQILTQDRGAQAGWWSFAGLGPVVHDWVHETLLKPNYGFVVKLLDDKSPECETTCKERSITFDSSAASDSNLRPKLSVVYYLKAPSTSKVVLPGEGTRTARRLKLKASWASSETTGVTFQYRLGTAGLFKTMPSSMVHDADGQSVSWPMAVQGTSSTPVYFDATSAEATLKKVGGDIQVRALFEGPSGVAGYSVPVNVKVDPNVGGTRDAAVDVGPGQVNLLTGNFIVSRTDVSISVPESALEFSRTHGSRDAVKDANTSVLGPGWEPTAPVEVAGGAAWQRISEEVFSEEVGEEEFEEHAYAVLTDLEGYEYAFEKDGNAFVSPPEASGWVLRRQSESQLTLTDPGGNRTTFEKIGGEADYKPVSVSQAGAGKTQMIYQLVGGKRRLSMIIAPQAASECTEANAKIVAGCRSLSFAYKAASDWGAPAAYGDRLASITYHAPQKTLSEKFDVEVARYSYDSNGKLVQQWDPRISPALKESYTYEGPQTEPSLKTLAPPGEEPWTLGYELGGGAEGGRLTSVKRPSLLGSPSVAETTLVYGVPISGSGAPYSMSGSSVAEWGQQDIPTDATAIFPPDQIPASPPTSYSRATVYYLDAEGMTVNTASPSGAGISAPSIATTETDEHGNIVRTLSAQSRLRALAAGANSVARSHELETKRVYSADGLEMQEEWGPLHDVQLESGMVVQARTHKVVQYDQGAPAPPLGTPSPHLPTRETVGASIPGQATDADQRVTETKYSWSRRLPTDTIVDPQGLNLRTHLEYASFSRLLVERRLPANPDGGDARTTKTVYYTESFNFEHTTCGNKPQWAKLPCKILPAKQPGTPGQPDLIVRTFASYSPLGQPTEILESPGGGTQNVRKTVITYDAAGRQSSWKQEGDGTSLLPKEVSYDAATGRPTVTKFSCSPGGCPGGDNQALTVTYDTLGRVVEYKDADGNVSSTSYDLLGRPATTSDGKGIQTHTYDPTSGLPVKLEDSGAGTFTASYDADGNLVEQVLPNGLSAQTTYDEAGTPVHLRYEKTTNCSGDCTWLEFDAEESIHGQWLKQTSSLSEQEYAYDEAGRLISVKDTPQPKDSQPTSPNHTSSFGSEGEGNGQFRRPGDVAIAPNGDIWVVDSDNNRVQHFDPQGAYIGKFGSKGTGDGQFESPRGIEFDGEGNIWILDCFNGRLQKFNQAGQFLAKFGGFGSANGKFSSPKGIARDAQGNLWVADTSNGRIQKFSSNGTFLKAAGTSGPGDLTEPAGIDVSSEGEVFVADRVQDRVVVFNSEGEYLRAFGTEGDDEGELDRPVALDIDPQGRVWVGEELNKRVQGFDLQGNPVDTFGSEGSGAGEMDPLSPMGITTDAEGSIWLTDTGNHRVQKWEFKAPPPPPVYGSAFGSNGSGNGQFKAPSDVAVDSQGNLWVTDKTNNRIQKFDASGKFLATFGTSGSGNGQFNRPSSIAIDGAGNILVADSNNHRIQKLSSAGAYISKFGSSGSGNGQLNKPEEVVVDPQGNIWVADTWNGRVQKFNDKGEFLKVVDSGQLTEPMGMDIDPSGNLWVTDWQKNRLSVFDKEGEFKSNYGSGGSGNGHFAQPDAVEIDGEGNVWVVDAHNARVQRFNLVGQYIGQFGSAGSGAGQFSLDNPGGLASDAKGNLWITDVNNHRVQKWSPINGCMTRTYTYDANSNRTKLVTRTPGSEGACDTSSAGVEQNYTYDAGDRLIDTGISYDNYGRTTSLPGAYSGGGALTSAYYVNDLVRSQTQDGITNAYELDAGLRQRQRTQTGTKSGTEIYHYADGSDSPAWIDRGSSWSRNVVGTDGGLAAIQDSAGGTILQLSNLHGDIVATASLDPEATELLATFESDEFGNPKQPGAPKYGWLGSKQRRTEFSSGVVQMGVRGYVPAMGRFTSVDPVLGASANAYEYAMGDPINMFDLDGKKPHGNTCVMGIGFNCVCQLHIKMWSPKRGRMGVRIDFKCNRAFGVSKVKSQTRYERRISSNPIKGKFEGISTPTFTNTSSIMAGCRPTDPCQNNMTMKGTFVCQPGVEYQIIHYRAVYANVRGKAEGFDGEVKAQEYCSG